MMTPYGRVPEQDRAHYGVLPAIAIPIGIGIAGLDELIGMAAASTAGVGMGVILYRAAVRASHWLTMAGERPGWAEDGETWTAEMAAIAAAVAAAGIPSAGACGWFLSPRAQVMKLAQVASAVINRSGRFGRNNLARVEAVVHDAYLRAMGAIAARSGAFTQEVLRALKSASRLQTLGALSSQALVQVPVHILAILLELAGDFGPLLPTIMKEYSASLANCAWNLKQAWRSTPWETVAKKLGVFGWVLRRILASQAVRSMRWITGSVGSAAIGYAINESLDGADKGTVQDAGSAFDTLVDAIRRDKKAPPRPTVDEQGFGTWSSVGISAWLEPADSPGKTYRSGKVPVGTYTVWVDRAGTPVQIPAGGSGAPLLYPIKAGRTYVYACRGGFSTCGITAGG